MKFGEFLYQRNNYQLYEEGLRSIEWDSVSCTRYIISLFCSLPTWVSDVLLLTPLSLMNCKHDYHIVG